MIKRFKFMIVFTSIIISAICLLGFAYAHENLTIVEANILGFGNGSAALDVSIEVPDYIFIGNVTKNDPVSKELTVWMNNTGKLPITVTPQLKDSNEIIFSYLFFREQKSDEDNVYNISKKIGDFSMKIDKPAAGANYQKKRFYMQLDLTGFNGAIKEDLIGYKSEIVFLAMPQ